MAVNATLLIKNGHVHDGTGAPAFHGDIAVDGDLIVAVGEPGSLDLAGEPRVIDAEGMLVCPGWVDVHTHCEFGGQNWPPVVPHRSKRGSRLTKRARGRVCGVCSQMMPKPLGILC